MIANISSGHHYYGVLNYHQLKVNKGEAKIIKEQDILDSHPKRLHDYFNQFSQYSNTKKPVFHASLSFPKQDVTKLNDTFLNKVSQEYLEQMGYGKQPYIIYRHYDREHPHIHIVSTRVDVETEKSISSKFEGKRSQKITEALEQKYQLTIAKQQTPFHRSIRNDVLKALQKAPITMNALNKNLAKNQSEYRAKLVGKGMIYYKVDGESQRRSRRWKSSDFKDIGLDKKGLENQFSQNQIDRKYLKKELIPILKKVSKISKDHKIGALSNRLADKGIQVQMASNDKGIYGWSFSYKGKNFKASEIDKNLSWNQWKQSLNSPKYAEGVGYYVNQTIQSGKPIEVAFKKDAYHFTVAHPDKGIKNGLEDRLRRMDNEDAYQVARIQHHYVKEYNAAPTVNEKKLIGQLAGNEAEDYLQRQFKLKQKRLDKQLKIKR